MDKKQFCEISECNLERLFLSLLPNGAIWAKMKDDILNSIKRDYYHMGDVAVLVANFYKTLRLELQNTLDEYHPLTASSSLLYWINSYDFELNDPDVDFSIDGLYALREFTDEDGYMIRERAYDIDLSEYFHAIISAIAEILHYATFSPMNFNVATANRILERIGVYITPLKPFKIDPNKRINDGRDYYTLTFRPKDQFGNVIPEGEDRFRLRQVGEKDNGLIIKPFKEVSFGVYKADVGSISAGCFRIQLVADGEDFLDPMELCFQDVYRYNVDKYLEVRLLDNPKILLKSRTCEEKDKYLPLDKLDPKKYDLKGAELNLEKLILNLGVRLAKILLKVRG